MIQSFDNDENDVELMKVHERINNPVVELF